MNRLISFPLNGGRLPDITLYGTPCLEKILSSSGMSATAAAVECTTSTPAYREYVAISNSFPVESGPRKSMWTVCEGVSGVFDILIGTGGWARVVL